MIALICAYLVLCPVSYWIGLDLREVQEIFYQMSSVLIIMYGMMLGGKEQKKSKLNLTIVAMAGWLLIQYFQHSFMGYSILMNFVLGAGVYFTVINNLKMDDIPKLAKTIITVAVLAIVYLGIQHLGYDIRGQQVRNAGLVPLCSFFGIEHAFGMYVGFAIPFLLATIGIWAIALVPLVIFSKSTGAMIGIAISILFYYWFRKRLIFWLLLIPILFGSAYYIVKIDNPMGMQKSRIDMWCKVIQDSHIKPFGYGMDSFRQDERVGAIKYFKYPYNDTTVRVINQSGNWMMEFEKNDEADFRKWSQERKNLNTLDFWDHPHNEAILILHDHGIPGFLLVVALIIFVWRRFWFSTKNNYAVASMGVLIAFSVFSMTQFPLHIARLGHILPVILGIFYISTENEWQS